LAQQREMFDATKYPFHQHSQVQPFICRESGSGRPVARACAIVNGMHLKVHDDGCGFFGFFESHDEPAACAAVLGSVRDWLRPRGCTKVLGPASFSTNDECGVLVEGDPGLPVLMMPHNPPYYDRLLTTSGLSKAKDLVAWFIDVSGGVPDRLRAVSRLAQRRNATVRPLDFSRLRSEVEILFDIYNRAWEKNWGFVPMTRAEFDYAAKHMKTLADPDLILVLEVKGEPAGFSLTLPDLNPALKAMDGRLFPFGALKFLWHRRKVRRIRVTAMGLLKEYRGLGLDALLYFETFERGMKKGYTQAEMSWILEDNTEMNTALAKLGARCYRRYRMYGGEL
jgi:GNAT superfamily N-acetyltransferase